MSKPESGPPLTPWRAHVSLMLGLGGMICYAFGLHIAVFKTGPMHFSDAIPPSFPPIISSFGCASFVGSILLSFQVRLRGLLILVLLMGALIGVVVSQT